ncbi:spondin-1-like isoform X2 [Tigriopus californicus]|uniref:spondin-1-like isoform X2 n=1 Tax=Tigriopus californicus TaxID=6832 RepID=UPI0027D9D27C|nr:spondin-1-like isoform X2 [Tigriopus californicus]
MMPTHLFGCSIDELDELSYYQALNWRTLASSHSFSLSLWCNSSDNTNKYSEKTSLRRATISTFKTFAFQVPMEPVIKVRYKPKRMAVTQMMWFCCVVALVAMSTWIPRVSSMNRCDKSPQETSAPNTEGDNGFAITITGSPRLYRPEQIYTIKLTNINEEVLAKFQGFMVVAEPSKGNNGPMGRPNAERNLGKFHLLPGDAMTKFSHRCSHSVEAASSISKESVQFYWTAPPIGSGCIDFHAMIEERKDVWYADDGSLTYTLCEDKSPLAKPPIIEPCCACNEAKYEVYFEGIWSRHTHPKDFPPDEWQTEFSQLIGASHNLNYSFWEYGQTATQALQLLGEKGITFRLESQMKLFSDSIRSVIKAHGLQQRSNVMGRTFAVFRVDPNHHLLSLVSKMIPSPDWIVGLSKENLCLADCTWVENRVIDLYPWDIGTQSGMRYDSPDQPTNPRSKIQRITSSNPNDPESPFFDETSAPMKPAARLHILKQREYKKPCPPGRLGPINNMNPSWSAIGGAFMPDSSSSYPDGSMGMPGSIGQMNPGMYGGENQNYGDLSGGGGGNGGALGGGRYDPPSNNYDNQNSYLYGEGIGQPTETELYGQGAGGYDPYGQDAGSNSPYGSRFPTTTEQQPNENSNSFFGNLFSGGNSRNDQENEEDNACQLTEWGQWEPCSQTCSGPGSSRVRWREYVYKIKARYSSCQEQLMDKEPCRELPKCESRDYGQAYNPFREFRDDRPWSERGLQSDALGAAPVSYSYDSGSKNYDPSFQSRPSPYNPPYRSDGAQQNDESHAGEDEFSSNSYGNSYIYGHSDTNGDVDLPRYSKLNALPDEYDVEDQNCQVTQWGAWSDCSSQCGTGHRTRQRRYTEHDRSAGCSEELDDQEPCMGQGKGCPNQKPGVTGLGFGFTNHNGYFNPNANMMCAMTSWGEWSPCSSKCGTGTRMRMRLFRVPFVDNRRCDISLIAKEICLGTDEGCDSSTGFLNGPATYDMDASDQDDEFDLVSNQMDPYYQSVDPYNRYNNQYELHDNEINIRPLPDQPRHVSYSYQRHDDDFVCSSDPDPGSCQGHFPRWYYDTQSETCKEFSYTGCKGNKNNFISYERCMSVCGSQFGSHNWDVEEQGPFGKLKAMNSIKIDRNPRVIIDCQVSTWSEWSECSKSCGIGWQTREREIILETQGGGKRCPRKLERRRKCSKIPCPTDSRYWYRGSWRHMVSNDDVQRAGK